MPDAISQAIEQSSDNTIQARGKGEGTAFLVSWLARIGLYMTPWWSPARDVQLRKMWKEIDHLSGAIYTMTSKMSAIPCRVVARDPSNKEHILEAEEMTDILLGSADFGNGWVSFYQKFVEDLITQDNGSFVEIIAPGDKSSPFIGKPISVAHLDSARSSRTGNPIYPVVYQDTDGKKYKIHYSRVIFGSQMPSPISEMHDVGVCGVSRCSNIAQTLMDILIYKQEKLGSRPHRAIVLTRGGLDPQDVQSAFNMAEGNMDSVQLTRYSKLVVGGSSTIPEADLKLIELSSLPDGFDERTSIELGMAVISLALGMDARELFPAMTGGATRADAILQHLKQRGKGPGQILQLTEHSFNYKYLPKYLRLEYDYQDDAQDRQIAEIRQIRANSRVQDQKTDSLHTRIIREQMVKDGDIDRSQFERSELEDGRMPDGSPVLSLFYTKNKKIAQLLDLGVEDPLDYKNNNAESILSTIEEKRREVLSEMAVSTGEQDRWIAIQANAALCNLETYYLTDDLEKGKFFLYQKPSPDMVIAQQQNMDAQGESSSQRPEYRVRQDNPTEPTNADSADNTDTVERGTEELSE